MVVLFRSEMWVMTPIQMKKTKNLEKMRFRSMLGGIKIMENGEQEEILQSY